MAPLLSNLRHLSINTPFRRFTHYEAMSNALRSLSSTLEGLELTFIGAEVCLVDFSLHPALVPVSEQVSPASAYVPALWSAKAAFPRLQRLIFRDNAGHSFLRNAGLGVLPDGLTALEMQHDNLVEKLDTGLLPRAITHLAITRAQDLNALQLASLPPNLLILTGRVISPPKQAFLLPHSVTHAEIRLVQAENAKFLPPNLRSLEVLCALPKAIDSGDEAPALLPKELSVLRVSTMTKVGGAKIRCFPDTITDLSIRTVFHHVDAVANYDWPRSLTRLEVLWMDKRGLQHFPPTLRHLEVFNCGAYPSQFAYLPRSLTYLHIDWQLEEEGDEIFDFPPNLKTLRLTGSNMTDQLALAIPHSVTHLIIAGYDHSQQEVPRALNRLPHLKTLFCQLHWGQVALLPRNLTDLSIQYSYDGPEENAEENMTAATKNLPPVSSLALHLPLHVRPFN